MRLLPLVLTAAGLNLAVTCGTGSGDPSETPLLNADPDKVLLECRDICRSKLGLGNVYIVDEYDPSAGFLRTEWKVQMSNKWREGNRQRIRIDVRSERKGAIASVEVSREINDNNINPLGAADASWLSAGNNTDLQDRIVWLLRLKFTDWKNQ